ncbi:ATP-binding cassette domain-containing protein [Streptomyces sp. NPDC051105]|uniref:ABC transporter ATP-binding protein n=1 Tax=Streptomyces sp. NPDC051105 TaxID=3154843 RepID=UPI0034493BEA
MIEAFGLTSNPRKAHPPAVDDVSFEACAGRVTALLGKEGAGKTTALRLMLELQQGRGLTYFRGRPLHRIAHPSREVGVLLGDVPGHPARSVRGHLRMLCAATGVPVRRADEVLEAVGLVSLREERLGTLSRGVDRRLGLACALLPDPHTLVLDEPAHGLSTRESHWLHRMLRAHAVQGGTVLFTTSDPKEAARAADRVVTLEAGRLVADQEATEFARTRLRPRVAVRSPHAARLAALLTKEARTSRRSVEVVSEGGNRLSVYGSTTAEVGETAFRHGILVHQLADEVGDMGAGAGAEPPTDAVPEAAPEAERRLRGASESAAVDGARTVDEAATTERRDTPGTDPRQNTGGSPVTPQPRTSAGPRPVSQSRTADGEPGPDQPSNLAESSATAEQQPSTGALADGPAATPGSPHAKPSGSALAAETPTVAPSPQSAGAPESPRPSSAATASSQSPALATAPGPPTHATSPDPMSATVPAQPPSTADSAQPSGAASARPPADAASAHSSSAPAPAQPSATGSSAHPPAVPASVRPPLGAASAHPSATAPSAQMPATAASAQAPAAAPSAHPSATAPSAQMPATAASAQAPAAAPSARPQAAAASDQPQAAAPSPQTPPRPVPAGPSTPAASSQPPTPAVPGEAPTTRLSVKQQPPQPGQAPTAKLSARQPQPKPRPHSGEAPTADDDPTPPPAGPARTTGAAALNDPSPLPPAISVRSAPSPLRPLRYELRRAAGIGTGFVTCGAVLAVSALIAVLLARLGHTPQARLFAAWPRELPLPPAALGAGLLGALAFGDEFRHPALAADRGTVPRRLGLLTAKLVVSGATAVLLSFLTLGCDAEMLYLVYGRELAKVPADWLPMTASWFGLIVGCAWAGVLAAGVFRSTTAGLAAVLAVPVLVVPVVHKALQGSGVRMAAGLPVRMRETLLLQWPFGGERYLVAAVRVLAQPVGGAMALSLTALVCAYLFTTLRARLR